MTSLQEAKKIVRAHHQHLIAAQSPQDPDLSAAIDRDIYRWRGVYPFGEFDTLEAVYEVFWQGLKSSLHSLHIREDIFFAGTNECDDHRSVWVVSMGHFSGLFDKTWLGIRPHRKFAFLRYCSFHRVEKRGQSYKITETALHVDIPYLMMQVGQNPFPSQTGAPILHDGPLTRDGLLFGRQDVAEGTTTLATINTMIDTLAQWQSGLPLEEELALSWKEDMIWWGPAGIGTSYTIERYAKQHARPFRAGFTERSKTRHCARFAEGMYGGFFGWPNFTARPVGGFMGGKASETPVKFYVIDIYRREGSKLAENWVFIDLLYFWHQMGIDHLPDPRRYGKFA